MVTAHLRILLADVFLVYQAAATGYSQGPIIGVVSIPSSSHIGNDYLPKSYVDWVQSAGGRVMPLPSGVQWDTSTKNWTMKASNIWKAEQYEERFQVMQGLLLPGGDPWPQVSSPSVRQLLDLARVAATKGDYFPVWGICAGFETLMVLSSGDSCQARVVDGQVPKDDCSGPITYGWNSTNQSLSQTLSSDFLSSRVLGSADVDLLRAIQTQPLAANFHRAAVDPAAFEALELAKTFRVVSKSASGSGSGSGRDFVATVEGIDIPWYGTQWHPEKPAGEWGVKNGVPYEAINHSPEAIRLGQHMANVLVAEARRSSHSSSLPVTSPMLIINDVPRPYDPRHPRYMQTYSFNWTDRLDNPNVDTQVVVI